MPEMNNRELMARSRKALEGKWTLSAVLTLISFLLLMGLQYIPKIGTVLDVVVGVPVGLGFSAFYLAIWRGDKIDRELFVNAARQSLAGLGAKVICAVLVVVGTLFFVIPGMIIALAVSSYLLVLVDDPSAGSWDAIKKSYRLSRGNLWRMNCLFGRFTGWIVLSICTFGVGFLWVGPYLWVACAGFYDELKREHAERLRGEALAEPAERS